jgi:hypothetical protein
MFSPFRRRGGEVSVRESAKYWSLLGQADIEEIRETGIASLISLNWTDKNASHAILALVLTVLNAVKPLQLDDYTYYGQMRQIAEHPLDPYGFIHRGGIGPIPGFNLLLPPVLPYWLAPAVHVFGTQVFFIKLALFPVSFLLVFSTRSLLRRFAPGLVGPLLWMTALGPVILPLYNMMLDVPETALYLAAMDFFTRTRVAQAGIGTLGWAGSWPGGRDQVYGAFAASYLSCLCINSPRVAIRDHRHPCDGRRFWRLRGDDCRAVRGIAFPSPFASASF